jgi:hypothetical protein
LSLCDLRRYVQRIPFHEWLRFETVLG